MKMNWINLITVLAMFDASCVNPTTSHTGCQQMTIVRANDAKDVPVSSFAFVESTLRLRTELCSDESCTLTNNSMFGSGFFVHRLDPISNVGFIMTADHVCQHRLRPIPKGLVLLEHEFVVYDYYGRKHEAGFYLASTNADICVIIIKDMPLDVPHVKLANSMPAIGSRVFNVTAPKKYFMPGAAVIYDGLYSGFDGEHSIFTIPTERGSSGSPIFSDDGLLIGMTVSVPLVESDNHDSQPERVSPVLNLAEPLHTLQETLGSIMLSTTSIRSTMPSEGGSQ